jgi:hypothetical protein
MRMRSEVAPPIGTRWIKANAIAAVVSAASSLAVFGLRQLFGVSAPAGLVANAAFLLGAAVLYGVSGAAWGVLTGAVLQRIVPTLPVRAWVSLHAVLTCVVLAGSEFLILAATQSLLRVPAVGATEPMPMHEAALLSLALGGTAGVVIGAVEALVLRKVARGLGPWIGWSAVAFAAFVLIVVGIEGPRPSEPSLGAEFGRATVAFLASLAMAVLMLPGVRRLQPL